MVKPIKDSDKPIIISADQATGGEASGSTLLPMLIAGLIMILIGAVVVMVFV